ncbi:MAG: polymerase primary sigma factor [Solirubrobacteraceae bacterium]|jgi:RNA polymerase sigma factor (sigma-70 family)|nr:polymerase primary sigma factor [Solirubrobacteraceae bacterium]
MAATASTDVERDESEALAESAVQSRKADHGLATALGMPPPAHDVGADYLDELGRRRAPEGEEERELVRRAQGGDARARAQLVEAYLPRISAVARHYRTSTTDRVELVQEGMVGLLEALEHYDPERHLPFWPYARSWVRRSMQHLLRELSRPTVLSDHALRRLSRIRDAHDRAVEQTHREPTVGELAERTGMDKDEVAHLLAADRPPRPIQETRELDDGGTIVVDHAVDHLAEGEYERVLDVIEGQQLLGLLSRLSERERTVLRMHHGLDGEELSHREIAERLGISTSRVRKIERRARAKLAAAAQTVSS